MLWQILKILQRTDKKNLVINLPGGTNEVLVMLFVKILKILFFIAVSLFV